MALVFFKTAATQTTASCTQREACHCVRLPSTSDGQEHKIIWDAGPERNAIFHLRDTACRRRGSHHHEADTLVRRSARARQTQQQASTLEWSHIQLPSTLDIGTTVPIAQCPVVMLTHILVTCDTLVRVVIH